MKIVIAFYFAASYLALSSTAANAVMVGSCLIKDKKDEEAVALCETLFTNESEKIFFGEEDVITDEEWSETCGGFMNPKGKEWNSKKECPAEKLVGVCHDKSGASIMGRGSLHYYESYLKSGWKSLSELKDECISRGKIFTKTNSNAEYEEAVVAIPSDLKAHEVIASCLMPSPTNPEQMPKCEQYHLLTETESLEKRKSDCIGDPDQRKSRYQKVNTWSTTDTNCPSKFNYAVCKSAVLSEYYYEDESSVGKERMDKLKLGDKVECESSGRRYIPVD